jgi:lipase
MMRHSILFFGGDSLALPIEHTYQVNGGALAVYEWPGAGPSLLFVHATGFHARCWDQVIARLPGQHCLAVDMRGHGRSYKPAPPYHWPSFAEDLVALSAQLQLRDAIGIGHSMGGYALTLAEAMQKGRFAKLLLLDPTILPHAWYSGQPLTGEHFAARRRNQWSSAAEMFERFKDREPFVRWDINVLRNYCEYGLLPAPDGVGFELACPPAIESSIYQHSTAADIYRALATIEIPVQIVRAGRKKAGPFDMSASPTLPELAAYFQHGRDLCWPDHSHFIPMEVPAKVAELVAQFVNA